MTNARRQLDEPHTWPCPANQLEGTGLQNIVVRCGRDVGYGLPCPVHGDTAQAARENWERERDVGLVHPDRGR